MKFINPIILLLVITFLLACKKEEEGQVIVVKANGDINARLQEFRHLLGDQLNTEPNAVGGRREINWDGVADQFIGQPLPGRFFNPVEPGSPASRQRGLLYESDGILQVSKNNFSEVNAPASAEFASFSGNKSFTNISSNGWPVGFEIPGQASPASIKGFGLVFIDVDIAGQTFLDFYNEEKFLGRFTAPVQAAGSKFSFLGVYFKNERITKVKISHGNGLLKDGENDISNGGTKDLVILDDMLYDEPIAK